MHSCAASWMKRIVGLLVHVTNSAVPHDPAGDGVCGDHLEATGPIAAHDADALILVRDDARRRSSVFVDIARPEENNVKNRAENDGAGDDRTPNTCRLWTG